jgi:nickel-dependent lactate racemase
MTQSLQEILTEPLGFPNISQTMFSGDRVLLVPDAEYAGEPESVAEIVAILLQNALQCEDVTILLTDAEETAAKNLLKQLPDGVRILFHKPERSERLALLGVNGANEPIVLCRELIDADLVISIGRFYRKKPKNYFGVHSAIFPRFSDLQTQIRFAKSPKSSHRQRIAEVEEVARQLGIVFTIQFLKERGKPTKIAAGLPELVAETLSPHVTPSL